MPYWYEVFDNEQVNFLTRRRVFKISAAIFIAGLISMAILIYAIHHPTPDALVIASIAAVWLVPIVWLFVRLSQLRRIVWCIKLSDREIIGFDHARRKRRFDWLEIGQINLASKGLEIVTKNGKSRLEIPHLYPDFAVLSHRIAEYAELYEIPVCVNGRPWELIDVRELYPFLETDSSSTS